ncbi:hypothetical protein HUJ05_007451 [Dendroctonus ponderosae]|nr:hypothetical protein HUJ05_007451 [Dendroctonus ponderosae]
MVPSIMVHLDHGLRIIYDPRKVTKPTSMPRESPRVIGAVNGIDGDIVLTSPVRKERLKRSKKEIAEEAAKVLREADKIGCIANDRGPIPKKFYTLPSRKKEKSGQKDYPSHSLDRRVPNRRDSLDLRGPKKPPRTFATVSNGSSCSKPSIFDIFSKSPKSPKPKKSSLRRSVSDASALRSKAFGPESDAEEISKRINVKKQLSPIIEVTQREDYFAPNEENEKNPENRSASVTDQLKNYIEEVDAALYKETGIRIAKTPSPQREPQPIIIDVDKAENISSSKRHKLNFNLGKKLKSITQKKPKANEVERKHARKDPAAVKSEELNSSADKKPTGLVAPTVKDSYQPVNRSPDMIHSSQKPVEKPPLTKGKAVNSMVKRLSSDSCSSPPPARTNVLIMPNIAVQHNNNQPFSYTRGISPDKCRSSEDLPRDSPPITKPVIYAQVVCTANGKQNEKLTVHRAFNGRRPAQSDSDEGLGGEDSTGFNRKYDSEKLFTHFGDDQFESYQSETEKLLDEIDKYKAESPILPKYRSPARFSSCNGIMERGRGDGMDSKRRESLTEADQMHSSPSRVDLSARRDLLESRINRRISDKTTPSPEFHPTKPPRTKVYVSEKSSKYYRNGSSSPAGFKEKYMSETKADGFGERHFQTHTKKVFGEPHELSDTEPKSLEYPLSDYRSSPETQRFEPPFTIENISRYEQPKLLKDKNMYRSTPEIHNRTLSTDRNGSYHDSLPREEALDKGRSQRFRSETFLNREESDRRTDRFVDSGIENDFRRDSSENYRPARPLRTHPDLYNESEDEGFASSLLITNERHHTETSNLRKSRKDYDSDINSRDEFYRHKSKYIPRERSIDDGSHYDPRIDKDIERPKVIEKKPPKPEKKSGLEKVKSLFTREKKKDKSSTLQKAKSKPLYAKQGADNERISTQNGPSPDYRNRRRLSTPSPSRDGPKKPESTHSSWFKSLDRLTKRKEKRNKDGNLTSTEDEGNGRQTRISSSTSNLRFFGDTDQESTGDSLRGATLAKKRPGLRSQSTRELHNISEESRKGANLGRKSDVLHKSLTNISETDRELKGSRTNLKPPMSPTSRYMHDREDRRRRKRPDMSSVESSTEGDSSQQSQRSIVYLHAATVGDIPGPEYLRNGPRAASREDLTSSGSSFIQPQVKTLSRSFSVLAPWKPRHQKEALDIDYTQYNKNGKKFEQRTARNVSNRNDNSTLKRRAQENRRNNQQSLNNRNSRSKENLAGFKQSKDEILRGSTSTLYKKKDKLPRENSRYIKDKDERKMTSKSQSVESIARRSRGEARDVSRSVSMPRDTEKTAGWFKKSKKSSNAHRL